MLSNKYTKWYFDLIDSRKSLVRSKKEEYYEKHHILPRCLGGNNKKENIVLLTAKEHFIAHLLLTKMYEGEIKYKMCWALHRLSNSSDGRNKLSSSQYDMARKIHSQSLRRPKSEKTKKLMSKPKSPEHREKISENNKRMWDTRDRTVSEEIRLKRLNARLEKYPDGVRKGAILSDETKAKIRDSVLKTDYILTEEQKENHLLAVRANAEKQKGVSREGQALLNIQIAQKLRWERYYAKKERNKNEYE